ncbi:YceI family protein [Fulvivirgaceae bacterium PWU20]|uniref:YceI family protein n=1 Tax=Chryseosolibacter indicus TaxID=2782351 RepID=A0ABS5VQB5_9BACT|nr:YceI family protein [Chryseosolibacter indicus]
MACSAVQAQKFVSEKNSISFFSDAAIEDIAAVNNKCSSIFNAATGDIVFSVPINGFEFEKSLMQEHFNEKYMESDKYPKSTFQGAIAGFDISKKEIQNVSASGKLTIHGVTKDLTIPGTIQQQGDKLLLKAKFVVKLVDYKITIPQLLWQNIAEQVDVTIDFTFKPQ